MYEQFFGLSENPFSLTPDPRFIFASRSHDEAVAHLRYWVEHHEGFATITGEVGTGKTTALFRLIAGMDRHVEVAFVTNSMLSPVELLEEICRKFRIDLDRDLSKPALLSKLEGYLQRLNQLGHGAVLIIDEAQNFDHPLLEEVRLLSNVTRSGGPPLLQIALVGQPELERRLNLPELRQLKQRIGVHYRIEPLSPEETGAYINHRVGVAGGHAGALFPPETAAAIHAVTCGLPREINQVASQALLHAFVEESRIVRPEHVASAVGEMGFKSVLDRGMTLTVAPPVSAESTAPGTTARRFDEPAMPAAPGKPAPAKPAAASAPPLTGPPAATPLTAPPRGATPLTTPPRGATSSPRPPAGPPPVLQSIPPIQGHQPATFKSSNPAVRRLALTGVAVLILGVGALLLFAPPRNKVDDLAEMESEATIPKPSSPQVLNEPTVTRIIPGIDPAKVKALEDSAVARAGARQPAGASTGRTETDLIATGAAGDPARLDSVGATAAGAAAVSPPGSATPRDSIEHRPPEGSPAAPAASAAAASRMSRDAMSGYHLQVASLRDSTVAESMGRRLGRLSESAFHIDRFPGGNFPWYAVYLGPYETRAEAESMRVELARIDPLLQGSLIRPPAAP